MTAAPVVFLVTGVTVTAPLCAVAVRRLLGRRLPLPRTLPGGVIAVAVAAPTITAIIPRTRGILPALWFVGLGYAIALLAGMTFLVAAETLVPSGSLPGPFFLIRGLRQRLGRARRYGQISRILVRRGLLPYLRGGRRAELRSPAGRARLARSLRLALEQGGVTFIKLGQVLATRRDLLAEEFVAELSGLQDDACPVPWEQIDEMIRAELGAGADELFAAFDRTPLAAASIAQVHAATLASGQRVVVKVCRPGAPAVVGSDLAILERLAGRLQRGTRWGRSVGTVGLARGFSAALREELDLRAEERNMTSVAAAAALRGDRSVRIPVPVPSMSARRVLVMDRLDGRPLSAIGTGLPPGGRDALACALLHCLLRQILIDGVFHADPHPGNVLVLDDGRPGLLDFGSVGRIDAGMRAALQQLLLAADRGDPAALTDALLEITERPGGLDEDQLQRALGRFLARHLAPGPSAGAAMFPDLFRIVAEHGLAIPPEIAAVFRALGTMEGTLAQLSPGFDTAAEARRFAAGYLAGQLRPGSLRQAAAAELASALPMLRRLPRRLDRISAALETGRLGVSVRLLADERDRQYVTGLVHRVLVAFLAATSGIMAVLMLGLSGGPRMAASVTLYEFLGYCLLIVAAVLALRVLAAALRPGAS